MSEQIIRIQEDDGNELLIDKLEISQETDIGYLRDTHLRVEEATRDLAIAFKTFAEAGIASQPMGKKLSVYRIAQSWIETRLKKLGHSDPRRTEKEDRQANEITRLMRENHALRERIAELEGGK